MSVETAVHDPTDRIGFVPTDADARSRERTTLLVRPQYFGVSYRINPYMRPEAGADAARAREQWDDLRGVYDDLPARTTVLDPDEAVAGARDRCPAVRDPTQLPDMVFCANHGLALPDERGVVLSRMATSERADEVDYFAAWCEDQDYTVHTVESGPFEGTGDAIWHPGRRLLWGGYGIRTSRAVYDELADLLGVPVLGLELVDKRYYHLDVCFAPLDQSTVLVEPAAFTDASRERIEGCFDRVIEAGPGESESGLACNCHPIDGEHVVMGAGNPETAARVADAGFEVHEVPTDEFQKAGGSVRCLTLSLG